MNTEELQDQIGSIKSKSDKAINTLKGILAGINLDDQVNHQEKKELASWISSHADLIERNPLKELSEKIKWLLRNPELSTEAIEDMIWLCEKYETDIMYYNGVIADLQTLQGLFHGALSDGELSDTEIRAIDKWVANHSHLESYYPYDEIKALLLQVLADQVITDDERNTLTVFMKQFVDISDPEIEAKLNKVESTTTVSTIYTFEPNILFAPGKRFSFTGIMSRFARKDAIKLVEKFGCFNDDTVTEQTDYLIVGENNNPAWPFACYGRKIEKALKLSSEGAQISIVREIDFVQFIENNM